MQYNVAQLLKEPTGSTRRVQLEFGPGYSGDMAVAYGGSLEILRTHQGLLVRGRVRATVALTCGRCLNEFSSPSQLELEEEFYPLVDVNTGIKLAADWDFDGATIDNDHLLDLSEVLRQNTISAQPIKPLCSTDCQGLCHECGVDLNQESCKCSVVVIDPRWKDLAALLDKSET